MAVFQNKQHDAQQAGNLFLSEPHLIFHCILLITARMHVANWLHLDL